MKGIDMKAKSMKSALIVILVALSGILSFSITGLAQQDPRLDGHTILLLTFDEGEGDVAADLSVNGNDGRIIGAKWVEGKHGTALEFNGTASTHVLMPHSPVLDDIVRDITLEAWVKFPGIQSDAKVACKHESGGYSLELREGRVGSQPHINGSYQLLTGNTLLETDTWYYVATTYDGDAIRVYLDGEIDGEMDVAGSITISAAPLMVGANPQAGGTAQGQFFAGVIDEVRISDVIRTPEEMVMAMEKAGAAIGPLGKLTVAWAAIKAHR